MAFWSNLKFAQKVALASVILPTLLGIFGLIQTGYLNWRPFPVNYEQKILSTNFVGGLPDDIYIRHPLEASLSSLIGHKGGQYVVVVGPKGCGKSTLVQHVMASNPIGVIPVSMSNEFKDLYGAISVTLNSDEKTWNIKTLANLFNSTKTRARSSTGFSSDWVPTVVVELDRGTTDESVRNIARDIKLLCSDSGLCRGVLVLSDALAAFAVPKDPRVKFFWVDDFAEDLAHRYYDSLNFLVGPSEVEDTCFRSSLAACPELSTNYSLRSKIFSTIGTRVSDLRFLVENTRENISLIETYLEEKIDDCETTLKSLFGHEGKPSGANFEEVARSILKSPTKSVKMVSLDYKNGLVSPPNAATVLKNFHGLLYHIPSKSYRFYSRCHETAAKRMLN